MVNRAQLAASLAALLRQRPLASTKIIKEFQASRAKNKTLPRDAGGFLRFLDYAACLELDLNVNTSGKVKTHQRINRSGVGVEDVDKTLVCTHLELIAGILILVR